MPNIRSSADLRNNYNDISSYCHAYNEPVFITKNGKGDLAVMSMETYEEMAGRIELYSKLQEAMVAMVIVLPIKRGDSVVHPNSFAPPFYLIVLVIKHFKTVKCLLF